MPVQSPARLLSVDVPVEFTPPGGGPFSHVYVANQSYFLLDVTLDGTERSPLHAGNNSAYTALGHAPATINAVRVTPSLYPGQALPADGSSSAVSVTWYEPREQPPGPGASPLFAPPVAPIAPVPVGTVLPYAGAFAPTGWAVCDGSVFDPTALADLYAVIGNTYGGTSSNPLLPDLRGRVPVGAGQGSGLTNRVRASTFGEESVVLSTPQIPAHTHGVTDAGHIHLAAQGAHNHAVNDAGHNHTVTDPDHSHGVTDPTHTHTKGGSGGILSLTFFGDPSGETYALGADRPVAYGATAASSTGVTVNTGATGLGVNNATTGVSTATTTPAITVGNTTTGIGINNAGGGGGHDNMPPALALTYIIRTTA